MFVGLIAGSTTVIVGSWLSYYAVVRDREEHLRGVFIGSTSGSEAKHLVHAFQEDSLSFPMPVPVQPLVRFSFFIVCYYFIVEML